MERGRAKAHRPLSADVRRAAVERGLVVCGRGAWHLAHEELEPALMGACRQAARPGTTPCGADRRSKSPGSRTEQAQASHRGNRVGLTREKVALLESAVGDQAEVAAAVRANRACSWHSMLHWSHDAGAGWTRNPRPGSLSTMRSSRSYLRLPEFGGAGAARGGTDGGMPMGASTERIYAD
jgi:hypothetical protein